VCLQALLGLGSVWSLLCRDGAVAEIAALLVV